ncbi:MAG: signal peptidase I [Clostridiales bacterium]|nr:signal peptidase I [Clostridiales bacterium]
MKKLKRKSDLVFWPLNILLTLLLVLILLPQIFGCRLYYVATRSMESTIMRGSIVILEKVEFDEIKVGDILTFNAKEKSKSFTHRVVEINSSYRYFITKGDAGTVNDPQPTGYDYVVGRVKFAVPYIGFLPMLIDSTTGKIAVAAVYIVWIAAEIEIIRTKRGKAGVQE